jgi:ribulose-phosphate 3-epimerase
MNPIFPSILSTKFFELESRLRSFASNGIDFIHLDVMDGHFVNNISFGPTAIPAIRSKFDFKFDSHLMVSDPRKMIPWYIEAGSDWISFHVETGQSIEENIAVIKNNGLSAGLVLNPDTAVESVFPYIDEVGYVLIMSVFPGYGGQKFIEATFDRVFKLKEKIKQEGNRCLIQVDGGVSAANVGRLKAAGADIFVVGTFLYNSEHISETINLMQNKIDGV